MPIKILLGTNNQGKIKEFTQKLKQLNVSLTTPQLLDLDFDPKETHNTFLENAIEKAKAWAEKTKLITLVDDSGLVIEELNGQPGVYSKRFYQGSDYDRNKYILKLMKDIPENKREAKFVCVICLYIPRSININSIIPNNKKLLKKNTNYLITKGEVYGTIAKKIKGKKGFGYDPIFIPKGYNQPFAFLDIKLKNKLSHRAIALDKLLLKLK